LVLLAAAARKGATAVAGAAQAGTTAVVTAAAMEFLNELVAPAIM
jgi:hypothetical protein